MAINNMTLEQASALFTAVYNQATGSAASAPVSTADFVTMGQTALKTGYDTLTTAISQVMSNAIFSIRPYTRKLQVMEVTEQQYGNHTRKINLIDRPIENDERFLLVDGQSIDQYKVRKPQAVQTNFYGSNIWQKAITIYKDQLDIAFTSAAEFGRFIAMVVQNAQDMIEAVHENVARFALANLIGGTISAGRYVDLLAEYNQATGQSLTKAQALSPTYFADFARFIFAHIKAVSRAFTERGVMWHTNPTAATPVGGNIMRHTPYADQRLVTFAPFFDRVDANVLSTTFNDEYLRLLEHEEVSFWNNPQSPETIDVTASYMDTDGTIKTTAVSTDAVIGVLFDREAAGYTVGSTWSAPSNFNAAGGYTNIFYHFTDRYWNDSTENAVVFGIGTI